MYLLNTSSVPSLWLDVATSNNFLLMAWPPALDVMTTIVPLPDLVRSFKVWKVLKEHKVGSRYHSG